MSSRKARSASILSLWAAPAGVCGKEGGQGCCGENGAGLMAGVSPRLTTLADVTSARFAMVPCVCVCVRRPLAPIPRLQSSGAARESGRAVVEWRPANPAAAHGLQSAARGQGRAGTDRRCAARGRNALVAHAQYNCVICWLMRSRYSEQIFLFC